MFLKQLLYLQKSYYNNYNYVVIIKSGPRFCGSRDKIVSCCSFNNLTFIFFEIYDLLVLLTITFYIIII